MRHVLLFLLFLLPHVAEAQLPQLPRQSEERIVFHTNAGPLVFALFPDSAPQTVRQLLAMTKAGVYEGTHFARSEPGFVLQLSTAQDRSIPLSPEQQALLKKLPGEFDSSLRHMRGALSMARDTNDINSAESSFSILLGPAPHLDGQYTIFGRLESGTPVLGELIRVPTDANKRPITRLEVIRTEVVQDPARLVALQQEGLRPFPLAIPESIASNAAPLIEPAAFGLSILLVVLTVQIIFDSIFSARVRTSINLLGLFMGFFVLLISLLHSAHFNRYLALSLFLALLLIIRLLGGFDSPARRRAEPKQDAARSA
ncbi:MAG: peptidylprolyl isomerase [Deltaproteobacteria bacterium]|nr:peptidylprolyl isomerase [Deltaproteobacteria bacterium]